MLKDVEGLIPVVEYRKVFYNLTVRVSYTYLITSFLTRRLAVIYYTI